MREQQWGNRIHAQKKNSRWHSSTCLSSLKATCPGLSFNFRSLHIQVHLSFKRPEKQPRSLICFYWWQAGDNIVALQLPMFVIVHTSTSLLVWNLGIVLAYNSNERHLIVSKFVHKSTRYKKEHVVCVSDLLQRKKQRQPEWTESLCAWRPY